MRDSKAHDGEEQTVFFPYGIAGRIGKESEFALLSHHWRESAGSVSEFALRYDLPLLATSNIDSDGDRMYRILESRPDGSQGDLTYDRETRLHALVSGGSHGNSKILRRNFVLLERVNWARFHLTRMFEHHVACHSRSVRLARAFEEVSSYEPREDFIAKRRSYDWMRRLPVDELCEWSGDGVPGMSQDLQAFLVATRAVLDAVVMRLGVEPWARVRGVKWPASIRNVYNSYLLSPTFSEPIPRRRSRID